MGSRGLRGNATAPTVAQKYFKGLRLASHNTSGRAQANAAFRDWRSVGQIASPCPCLRRYGECVNKLNEKVGGYTCLSYGMLVLVAFWSHGLLISRTDIQSGTGDISGFELLFQAW
jgi:hypothetical protein